MTSCDQAQLHLPQERARTRAPARSAAPLAPRSRRAARLARAARRQTRRRRPQRAPCKYREARLLKRKPEGLSERVLVQRRARPDRVRVRAQVVAGGEPERVAGGIVAAQPRRDRRERAGRVEGAAVSRQRGVGVSQLRQRRWHGRPAVRAHRRRRGRAAGPAAADAAVRRAPRPDLVRGLRRLARGEGAHGGGWAVRARPPPLAESPPAAGKRLKALGLPATDPSEKMSRFDPV
jgi:hypothetical protein